MYFIVEKILSFASQDFPFTVVVAVELVDFVALVVLVVSVDQLDQLLLD